MEETPAHRLDEALLTCEMDGKDGRGHCGVTPLACSFLWLLTSAGFPSQAHGTSPSPGTTTTSSGP